MRSRARTKRIARRLGSTRPLGGGELGRRRREAGRRQRQPIEFLGVVEERRVAALAHIVDDRACGRLDVLGDFALGDEKRREARLEIGSRTGRA